MSVQANHGPEPKPEPIGSGVSTPRLIAWVRAFRRSIAEHQDRLAELVHQDTGKPPFETITSDILPLLATCTWHEKHAPRLLRPKRAPGTPVWLRSQSHRVGRAPVGEVGIIATWNYPLLLIGAQLVQALVAGNRVRVKPCERSPRSQGLLLDLARQA